MSEFVQSSVAAGVEPAGQARRKLIASVARTAAQGPRAIDARLCELDQEWDIDRVLVEAKAVAAAVSGLALGLVGGKAPWSAFLLEQGRRGVVPPLFVLRALGVRSAAEIEYERASLRAARGTRVPATNAVPTAWSRAALAPAE
jgi:hypothetical protein